MHCSLMTIVQGLQLANWHRQWPLRWLARMLQAGDLIFEVLQ
jgi:hypothetical protein